MARNTLELDNGDYDAALVENIKERRAAGTFVPDSEPDAALRVSVNGDGTLGSGGEAVVVEPGTGSVAGTTHTIQSDGDRTLDVALPRGNDRRDVVVLDDTGSLAVRGGQGGTLAWNDDVSQGARTINNAYRPPPRSLEGVPGLVLAVVTVRDGRTQLDSGEVRDLRVGQRPLHVGITRTAVDKPRIETDEFQGALQVRAGDSLRDAVEDTTDGGRIDVTKAWTPENDATPILVDKAVAIVGPGAFSERIFDFTGGGPYAFDIDAGGMGVFRRPTFQDLSISGAGYRITQGNPTFGDCVVNYGPEHGWFWPDDGNIKFDPVLSNCHAENMSGDAYHVAGKAHALQLDSCMARETGGRGVYTSSKPAAVSVKGGDYERNAEPNIEINSYAATVSSAYLERGNEGGTSPDKVGVYLGGEKNVVENCYHQAGSSSSSVTDVAVVLDGENCEVRNGHYTNYAEGFVRIDAGAVDADVNAASHYADTGAAVLAGDSGTRTRSAGVIGGPGLGGVDLGAVTGQQVDDCAISDGTVGVAHAPATWTGSEWRLRAGAHGPTDLSGTTGAHDGELRVDDGTNTPSGFREVCVWDATNSVWRPASDPGVSFG